LVKLQKLIRSNTSINSPDCSENTADFLGRLKRKAGITFFKMPKQLASNKKKKAYLIAINLLFLYSNFLV
jgi:hypothetical protein